MKQTLALLLFLGAAGMIAASCSSADSETKPAPWSAAGGSAGTPSDSGAGGNDASTAGKGGSAEGGSGVDGSAGCDACGDSGTHCDADLPEAEASTKDAGFWNGTTYGAQCPPNPPDGYHSQGQDCMTCHNGSIAPKFVFGGTVYKYDGVEGANGVELGVSSSAGLFVGCSATNGNFWVWGTADLDWSTAEIRMRNSKGEAIMKSTGGAACNTCHSTSPLITP